MEASSAEQRRFYEWFRTLRPIDDFMFLMCAEDIEWCQEALRALLNDDKLKVLESRTQHLISYPRRRSVILDAKCLLKNGRHVNIEVQKSDNDDHQRRVRYHASALTVALSKPNCKFKHIPDVCVIYICEFDIFKCNAVLYPVQRVLQTDGRVLNNGFQEIYVNASGRDDTKASELMRLFTERCAYNDADFPKISAVKREYAEDPEGGEEKMKAAWEKIGKELFAESLAECRQISEAVGEARGEAKGRAIGEAQGRAIGEAQGRAIGEAQGKSKGKFSALAELVKDQLLSLSEAARRMQMSEDEFLRQMELTEA